MVSYSARLHDLWELLKFFFKCIYFILQESEIIYFDIIIQENAIVMAFALFHKMAIYQDQTQICAKKTMC